MEKAQLEAIIQAIENFYIEMSENERRRCRGHWLDHVRRVVRNVTLICQTLRPEPNTQLVKVAALCHDIGYNASPKGHPRVSAEMCTPLLKGFGVSDEEILQIQSIILAHSRKSREPTTVEEKAMYIADKLDMIGFDGVIRMFLQKKDEGMISRDDMATAIQQEITEFVRYLRSLGIARDLVEQRWEESKAILQKVLIRGSKLGDDETLHKNEGHEKQK